MFSHHVYTALALAHERSKTQAARRAGQARPDRQRAGTSDACRSLLGWIPGWLRPGRSRLPGHRQRSAAEGRP
jgi:hypothetical protein